MALVFRGSTAAYFSDRRISQGYYVAEAQRQPSVNQVFHLVESLLDRAM